MRLFQVLLAFFFASRSIYAEELPIYKVKSWEINSQGEIKAAPSIINLAPAIPKFTMQPQSFKKSFFQILVGQPAGYYTKYVWGQNSDGSIAWDIYDPNYNNRALPIGLPIRIDFSKYKGETVASTQMFFLENIDPTRALYGKIAGDTLNIFVAPAGSRSEVEKFIPLLTENCNAFIVGKPQGTEFYRCLSELLKSAGYAPSVCTSIKSTNFRDSCLERVALEVKNPTICAMMSDYSSIKSCLIYTGSFLRYFPIVLVAGILLAIYLLSTLIASPRRRYFFVMCLLYVTAGIVLSFLIGSYDFFQQMARPKTFMDFADEFGEFLSWPIIGLMWAPYLLIIAPLLLAVFFLPILFNRRIERKRAARTKVNF